MALVNCILKIFKASSIEKLSLGFPTRSDTNQAVQSQKGFRPGPTQNQAVQSQKSFRPGQTQTRLYSHRRCSFSNRLYWQRKLKTLTSLCLCRLYLHKSGFLKSCIFLGVSISFLSTDIYNT